MTTESTSRMTRNASQSNDHNLKDKEVHKEQLYDARSLQYVEPTQSSLQCSVCCEYFIEPVSAPCGHTFCRACIVQALEVNSGCPLCRTTIDPTALYEVIALSRICDELMVYCPHKTLGCNHTCQRFQIGQHLKDECVYIGTLCRVEECRKKLLKKDLSEHMESCPYKRVDCLMCNTKVLKSELSHIKECPRQIIPCSLSEFGCPWKGPRFDLEAIHIPQCPYEAIRGFLEISKSKMEALEQENRHLKGIFHDLKPQVQQLRDQVGQMAESLELILQQEQQQAAGGNGGANPFGNSVGMFGYMDMNYQQYNPGHHLAQPPMLGRNDSFEMTGGMDERIAENEMRVMHRNSSIGAESMTSNSNNGGLVNAASTADTHELLISENERIRSEIETLTANLASLELKQNMAIMTESMRMQEEVQSLRAVCHGLRMQMHYLLLEQQNRHHPPGPPPPPGSPAGANGNQPGMKGGPSGGGAGGPSGHTGGGRTLSASGPPRSRFSDTRYQIPTIKMQHDTFKRFSRDLQDALVMPVNYLNKKSKKLPLSEKKKAMGLSGLTIANPMYKNHDGGEDRNYMGDSNNSLSISKNHGSTYTPRSGSTSDCVSLHNFSLSTISKTSCDDNHSFTSSNGSSGGFAGLAQQSQSQSQLHVQAQQSHATMGRRSRASSFLRSPLSPGVFGGSYSYGKVFPELKDEPALVHCPLSVASLDQFSPQRYSWVRDCLNQNSSKPLSTLPPSQLSNVLKTEKAWDAFEGQYENRNSEGIIAPTLNDVDKPFQLELEVTGTPVATKFGTMAGFSNTQTVHLGQLVLPLGLQSMEKSVHTYKLQRLVSSDGTQPSGIKPQSKEKADCEIVLMIGVHVLEEPVEDRSWETETLYQSELTVMTRGSRMASWKRYLAVLEGSNLKLYDAEYQLKRDPIAVIPLAYILGVQPPDYDKVDVSSNGFSIVISPSGVNMSNASEVDLTDMDFNLYAFTDSAYLHDCWTANLEEALEQYRENMAKRGEVLVAKRDRRRRSMVGGMTSLSFDKLNEIVEPELVDLRFVS
ncbi:hypothetical protein BGX27_011153 [Mortierella sp. AM989]|nr:hypothetical protein BGX27_011153 [Mortierella sp. AM989]